MASIAYDELFGPKIEPGETCDRCGPGTVALVAFRLPSGRTLAFCNHHARVHATALLELGVTASTAWPVPDRREDR